MKLGRKAVAIGVVGLLALTACGRADDDSTGGETSAGSTTTVDDAPAEGDITIWAMGEEGEKLPDFVQGFTEENPDANVEVTTIPWADVMTKFQTAVAAGTVPDAIMLGSSFLPPLVAPGGLAPDPAGRLAPAGRAAPGPPAAQRRSAGRSRARSSGTTPPTLRARSTAAARSPRRRP